MGKEVSCFNDMEELAKWMIKYLPELVGTFIGWVIAVVEFEVLGLATGLATPPLLQINVGELWNVLKVVSTTMGLGFVGGLGASIAKRLLRKYFPEKKLDQDIDDD
jgi:hypothetical protein